MIIVQIYYLYCIGPIIWGITVQWLWMAPDSKGTLLSVH